MVENLFLLSRDNALKTMSAAKFGTEADFQQLLARFPELLTNADFGEGGGRRWLLVRREAGIPASEAGSNHWSLDHLFLDQDGVPTLVEVKRASDPRARREVVAQMLDYAANAVNYWRVEQLAKWLDENCRCVGSDPDVQLRNLLQTDSVDVDAFWRGVQSNLTSGRIRLIFVADKITPELQRIVEFLNEQMDPATVVALELALFENGGERILSPRLIGLTSRAASKKNVGRPTASSIEEWIEQIPENERKCVPRIQRFIDILVSDGALVEMRGKTICLLLGRSNVPVLYIQTNGRVRLSLYMLSIRAPNFQSNEARTELRARFEKLGFTLAGKDSAGKQNGEPTFDLPDENDEIKWRDLKLFFHGLAKEL